MVRAFCLRLFLLKGFFRTIISLCLQLDAWWLWCGPLLFRTLERGSWKAVQLWGPGSVDPCGSHSHYHWICWTRGWLPLHILGSGTVQNGSWKFQLLGVNFDHTLKKLDHTISGPVYLSPHYSERRFGSLRFLGPGPSLHCYLLLIPR